MDRPKNDTMDELPIITKQDAADYLADILPQLAALAKTSGLADIGEMVSIVSNLAARQRIPNTETGPPSKK